MRKPTSAAQTGAPARTAEVDALLAALRADEGSRHSPIYRWLDRHASELSTRLGDQKINWGVFADYLASLNIVDGKGSRPTASVVRNAWQRVRNARGLAVAAPPTGRKAAAARTQDGRHAAQDNATAYPADVQIIDGATQELADRLL